MCNPHTYPQINRARFEGWKSNAAGKGVHFTGENAGELTWGPVPGEYSWDAGKLELTVKLDFETTDTNCVNMYRDLGSWIPPLAEEGPVTPPGPAVSIDESGRYTVIGRVLHKGIAMEGVRVQAWDHDRLGPDDKLGQAFTDGHGFFTISFDPSSFNDWGLDRDPDLYFKIFEGGNLIGETSGAVIYNAKPGEKDIVIHLNR
jgi:hypothetical protein